MWILWRDNYINIAVKGVRTNAQNYRKCNEFIGRSVFLSAHFCA